MTGIISIGLVALASVAIATVAPSADAVQVAYEHSLSTSFGVVPLAGAFLSYDRQHRELFVIGDGLVRVFNASGMEVYTFEEDPQVGMVRGIAALDDGDLLVHAFGPNGAQLVRCNFRGEFVSAIETKGVPAGYENAFLGRMRYSAGKIYLADLNGMRVLVLDSSGAYVASYDIAQKLELENERETTGLRGFNVDRDGNILFTIQPHFKAYFMSPAGEIRPFGQRGSAPGKFNIVGGIARDDAGTFYVADMLKSAILVFDRDFRFVREFGYRGGEPWNLAAPEELVVTGEGRLFVSQKARRGVSVFQVSMSSSVGAEGPVTQ